MNRIITQFLVFATAILMAKGASAQVIVTTPAFPTENDSCTILFDATQGNGELNNVAPPIYAHTGVITNLSISPTDWKYVVAGWTENTTKAQMTPLGNNKYQLKIKPSVRGYYAVPVAEQIKKMAFVFRNADGSKVGRNSDGSDIYADVYTSTLSVNITQPTEKSIFPRLNDPISIAAASPLADSMKILVNGITVKSIAGNQISETILANNFGSYWTKQWVKIIGKNSAGSAADSFSYAVIPAPKVADLPAGIIEGINYTDNQTVVLCLYAPYKKDVFVVGDFNNWTIDSSGYMNLTPDGNRWWRQIGNLVPKQEYIFQYQVDGNLFIADPYADKISDPDDKYISAATYPGLKPYPTGKAKGIASFLQTAQDAYAWNTTPFTPPAVTDLVIYELLIRDFIGSHNYPTLMDTLDYLKSLGVNAIELMPVMEFEGNSSWGYNTDFSFALDKYYGTKNAFKQFVEAAHMKGMAVILDIVCNHHFGQSPLVRLYWDGTNQRPASNNPWFNAIPKHPYNVGNDFNHESPATKAYMERLIKYWITEYHVDGYRFDLSKGFTQKNSYPDNVSLWGQYDANRIDILKNYANVIHSMSPKAYVILEHLSDNSEETVLAANDMLPWGNMTGSYQEAAMGYNTSGKSDLTWGSYQARGWNKPNLVAYMESHDEERMMYKNVTWGSTAWPYNVKDTGTALKRIELCATFYYTIPGPKMIWQFGELGYDYSINYPSGTEESRLAPKPIRWDYLKDWRRKYTNNIFASLIDLKKNQPAFETDNFTLDVSGAIKRIWLRHSTMDVTVLGNFTVDQATVKASFTKTGMWYEYFSGDSLNVTDVDAPMDFKPGEYRLYTTKKLAKPYFTGLEDDVLPGGEGQGRVIIYPNPARDIVNFSFNAPACKTATLTIYNVMGEPVMKYNEDGIIAGSNTIEVDLSAGTKAKLAAGIYLFGLEAGNFRAHGKFMLEK